MILHKALVDIKDWVDDGCPEHEVFKTDRSVCLCVEAYFRHIRQTNSIRFSLSDNMDKLSILMRGGKYPFNNNSYAEWNFERRRHSFYQNPKRLEWLVKHGRRTISDCVPLVIPTINPSFKVIVNTYSRNGKCHALPVIWFLARNLGVEKAFRELRENTIRYLVSLGIEVDHAL